jgi:glutathionylspermidine synthase
VGADEELDEGVLLEEMAEDLALQLENESEALMNAITVESVDDVADDDEEDQNFVNPHALIDVVEAGWKKIDALNIKRTRLEKEARERRKDKVNEYLISRVEELRERATAEFSIKGEKEDASPSPWTDYMKRLRPDMY